MAAAGIDAPAVATPGLAGLRDLTIGTAAHVEALAREFFGHPQIVGIEEGNQGAARERDPTVAGSGWSAPFDAYGAYTVGPEVTGGVA